MRDKQKIALVTGANGAIGRALLERLQKEGIFCITVDKDNSSYSNFSYSCNFSNPLSVKELALTISGKFPTIDYLFNVAGIGIYKKIDGLKLEEWMNSININFNSAFILSKYLLPNLKKAEDPMIFNIGSGMGVIASAGRAAYCSSKFGLRGLSLSLNKELKEDGIDVCLFTLGSVMTPFGTGGLKHRLDLAKKGKKYLSVSSVVTKIMSIVKSQKRKPEYKMYPNGYA